MATPHIAAEKGDFAPSVLMPGDPLRARFIAENYLESAKLVNDVRGVQGYTGEYKGKRVSVMASGMGMPSMGIYSYELFHFFDVRAIIRVGSAGAIAPICTRGISYWDWARARTAITGRSFLCRARLRPWRAGGCSKAPCRRQRDWEFLPASAISFPAIGFTTIRLLLCNGEKWASSRWKWRARRCI